MEFGYFLLFIIGLILSLLALFFACGGIIYACFQGMRAFDRSLQHRGGYALTLRLLGLNLCEPLTNAILSFPIWYVVGVLSLPRFSTLFFWLLPPLVAVGIAVASRLMARKGGHSGMQRYRYLYNRMLLLSLARLGITIIIVSGVWLFRQSESVSEDEAFCFVMLFYMVAIGLQWWTALWGKGELSTNLAHPQLIPDSKPVVFAPLPIPTPPPIPVTLPTTPLPAPAPPEPPVPYLLCPICSVPTPRNATECSECGLVFTSRVPSTLHNLRDYHVLRPLGGGGMSSVYLARQHNTDHMTVIKTLASVDKLADPHWHTQAAHCLRQEADLLGQLDHPHIAQVQEWISSDHGEFLVLEYVPGLTLEQRLTHTDAQGNTLPGTPLPVEEALHHGCTVASVLEYLASLPQPLVHHDIKPANLIVREEDGVLVLVDFGGAVVLPDSDAATVQLDRYGTPGYAAPEQYQGHSSPQSDIYGLAATLYHLLTDDDPADHPFQFPQVALLPTDVRTVLEPALAHEPKARPTAQTLRIALQMVLRGCG